MKSTGRFAGALMLAAVPASLWAAPAAAQTVEIAPFTARAISPAVHLLSTPEDYFGPVIGNVSIIEQRDGFVVIDSGLTAANGRAIVAYIRARSAKPVKAVAITHWHNDHPQGVSAIRDAWPKVRIIATSGTEREMLGAEAFDVGYAPDAKFDAAMVETVAQTLATYQKLHDDPATAPDRRERITKALAQFRTFPESFRGTYIVPPTDTFEREMLLDDADTPVRLIHLGRANTDGDLVAWLPRQRIVMSGDIVVAPTPFGFFSFPGDWIETIGKLKALGFATLIPGHGEPQTDSSYLDKLTAAISDIRAQVTPLARQGLSLEDVRKKVDFTKTAEIFGTTPRIKANFQGLFADPMIPNAYKEALGQPIIQGEGNTRPAGAHTPPKASSRRH